MNSTITVQTLEARALVEPAQVQAGSTVVLTPSEAVVPTCNRIGVLRRADATMKLVGQLKPTGEFLPGPDVTWLACLESETMDAIEYSVPSDVPPGTYALCVTQEYEADACAVLTVG